MSVLCCHLCFDALPNFNPLKTPIELCGRATNIDLSVSHNHLNTVLAQIDILIVFLVL